MLFILLSFLITAFGQPASIRGLGPLAAAFGFALFWKGMLSIEAPKRRFLLSLFWFAAVQGVQLSWMTSMKYMGPLIVAVYLFLILAMGLQFALLSFFVRNLSWRSILAISGAWTLFEWARLFFLCGFTWNPVGLSLADSFYSIQMASLFGIFGLSFWVMLTNLSALKAWLDKSTASLAVWGALAVFPYLFGVLHQIRIDQLPVEKTIRVALVQTALYPEQKEFQRDKASSYMKPMDQWSRILALLDPEEKPDLLVMPEAALPLGAKTVFASGNNLILSQALADRMNTHVIVGIDDRDETGSYNAAFHFTPKLSRYERYEKRVLVPVGEYVPFSGWKLLSDFVAKQFGIVSSFDRGKEAKVFQGEVPLGISICLEETFSSLARETRLKGAKVFVNLTNDVWFPGTNLPRQHFDHARVRAAENGVPIIRACNTGVTGWIDCNGQAMAQLPVSETAPSALYFSLPVRTHSTLYSLFGDALILSVSVLSLLLFPKKKLAVNGTLS